VPENPYNMAHRWSQVAQTSSYALARIRHVHPDWPECAAGCGWPVNPGALAGGYITHPMCDNPSGRAGIDAR
jgi:hypothetical protein